MKDDLRARHFAHHRKGACASYESYLHRAAKLAFLESYRECLSAGKAFTLRLPVVDTCNALEHTLGFRCDFPQYREIDLTRWFHAAELEQRHAGFVADILLLNTRSQGALLIEVRVTHPCEEAKIASGHRILELRIQSDRDIAELLAAIVTVGTERGHTVHNFRTKVLCQAHCAGHCPRQVGVMVVHDSGRLKLFQRPAGAALNFKPPSAVWRKILADFEKAPSTAIIEQLEYLGTDLPPGDSLFQRAAIAAIGDGIAVKSCEVCRRQGSPSMFGKIWCYAFREEVHPSRAASCEQFQSVRSVLELNQLRRRNQQARRRPRRY